MHLFIRPFGNLLRKILWYSGYYIVNRFSRIFILLGAAFFMQHSVLRSQGIVSFSNQLSSTCVREMMQDSYDNVWISTFDGLNRYDGSRINVYYHSDSDSSSLAHNFCSALFELEPGFVMVGSDMGVQIYNYDKDAFLTVPMIAASSDTVHVHVEQILRRKNGAVMACAPTYGIFVYDGSCFRESVSAVINCQPVGMMEDFTGNFWVYDSKGNVYCNDRYVGSVNNIRSLVTSSSGRIYASSANEGLKFFDYVSGSFTDVPGSVRDCSLWSIRPIDNDRILLCTDGDGLFVYDENSQSCYRPGVRLYDFPFETSNVKDAFVDSFGNMWTAIFWKGVVVHPAESQAFRYIGRRSVARNTIGNNCVTAIADDGNDMLWVGTDNDGLYHIKTDGTEGFHYDSKSLRNMPSTVMKIFRDRGSCLWLGSATEGVFSFDPEGRVCTPLCDIVRGADELKSCFDMIQDTNGDIWLASNGSGLYRLTKDSHKWKLVRYDSLLNNNYSRALLIYGDWLLVGTSDGLDILRKKSGELESVFHILSKSSINCLKMSTDGSVWIATNTGLYKVRLNTLGVEFISCYNSENGLSNDMMLAIEPVSGGELWVSTNKGLSLIDAVNGRVVTYTTKDGLENEQFVSRASVNIDGVLYFGGINGITLFRNSDMISGQSANVVSGIVRIVNLIIGGNYLRVGDMAGGKCMTDTWISKTEQVRLPQNYNSFSLELSTMNVCDTHQEYSYSIDGDEWIELAEGQHYINFTGLKTGKHSIFVRESGSGECSLSVRIMPAWYQSPVAITSYALLLFFVLLLLVQLRTQRRMAILKDEKHSHEVEEVRKTHRQEVERVRNIRRVQELAVESPDDHLMRRVMEVINGNLSNPELGVEFIAKNIGMSRAQLYRRIKEITDRTPHELLVEIRFKEAKRLLFEKKCDVTEVSDLLGFKSLSSFSSAFRNHFGVSPSSYINTHVGSKLPES